MLVILTTFPTYFWCTKILFHRNQLNLLNYHSSPRKEYHPNYFSKHNITNPQTNISHFDSIKYRRYFIRKPAILRRGGEKARCLRDDRRITESSRLRHVERGSSCDAGLSLVLSSWQTETRWVWRLVSVAWADPLKGGTVELCKRGEQPTDALLFVDFAREGERARPPNRIIPLPPCLLWLSRDLDRFPEFLA